MRVCSVNGCPTIYPSSEGGKCKTHRKEADTRRGTAAQRGYTSKGHQAFRDHVLTRDPICVQCNLALSTVADHWPLSRKELIDQGLNPNDPQHGRGLCKHCHDTSTAREQPGGWNAR